MLIREGGWTDRMHTWLKSRRYSVAEHTWHMMALAHQLFPADFTGNLPLAIMYHDVPERWVGDTPYTAKYILSRQLGSALKEAEGKVSARLGIDYELTERETAILHFCDVLEFTLWVREELNLGNKMMEHKFKDGLAVLMKSVLWSEFEPTFIDMMATPLGEEVGWWED